MDHAATEGLRRSPGRCKLPIDPCLERPAFGSRWLALLGRRHLAQLQLMKHLLPALGGSKVRTDGGRKIIQAPVTLLHLGVMTVEAVAGEKISGRPVDGSCGTDGRGCQKRNEPEDRPAR